MSRAATFRVKQKPGLLKLLSGQAEAKLEEFADVMVELAKEEALVDTGNYKRSITSDHPKILHFRVFSETGEPGKPGYGFWIEIRWKPVFAIAAERANKEVFGGAF